MKYLILWAIGESMLGGHMWKEAPLPVPLPQLIRDTQQGHEFSLMSPWGSAPMGDVACPEGTMQGLCLAAGTVLFPLWPLLHLALQERSLG